MQLYSTTTRGAVVAVIVPLPRTSPTPYGSGSWEWYDHGHDGTPHVCRIQLLCTDTLQLQVLGSGTITATTAPPRVCRIQLHSTDTLQLQVLGSGMITATTAPLRFVEYNYIVVRRGRDRTTPKNLQL
jgi:hypothetical protein